MQTNLVHHFLERHAQTTPDAVLVVEGDQRDELRRHRVGRQPHGPAAWAEGVERGDRIGLLAVNSREYIESYYGILKSGWGRGSLNAAADWRTHSELLQLCQARGLDLRRPIGSPRARSRRTPAPRFRHRLRLGVGRQAGRTRGPCRLLDRQELMAAMDDRPPDVRDNRIGPGGHHLHVGQHRAAERGDAATRQPRRQYGVDRALFGPDGRPTASWSCFRFTTSTASRS